MQGLPSVTASGTGGPASGPTGRWLQVSRLTSSRLGAVDLAVPRDRNGWDPALIDAPAAGRVIYFDYAGVAASTGMPPRRLRAWQACTAGP
jgi:hypothetical protein